MELLLATLIMTGIRTYLQELAAQLLQINFEVFSFRIHGIKTIGFGNHYQINGVIIRWTNSSESQTFKELGTNKIYLTKECPKDLKIKFILFLLIQKSIIIKHTINSSTFQIPVVKMINKTLTFYN